MSNFKGWEIVIVLVLVLLLFGAKRLPDAARGLGRSLRIFKAETKGLRDDDRDSDEDRAERVQRSERPDTTPIVPRELPSGENGAAPAPRSPAERPTSER